MIQNVGFGVSLRESDDTDDKQAAYPNTWAVLGQMTMKAK